MKFWKSTLAAIILGLSSSLNAAPLYYTFEGYIDNFGSDPAGEAADAGLSLFSAISYTLEVDFSASGSITHSDGVVEYLLDTSGYFYGSEYTTDYFYTSLIASSYPALSPSIPLSNEDYIDNNLGTSITWTNATASGQLHVADSLLIQSQHRTVNDWIIGEELQGFHSYGNELVSTDSIFRSSLTLTSISPVVVPVPAAIWLFGSGLIGLIGLAKRKKYHSCIKDN